VSGAVVFAQGAPEALVLIVVLIAAALFMVVALGVILKQYKRCPPNRILVVYGKTETDTPKCIHGGAVMVFPLLQDYAWLALEPIRFEVARQKAASGRTISDPLPRVFSVAIGTTPELMQNAAVRLLGLDQSEIKRV